MELQLHIRINSGQKNVLMDLFAVRLVTLLFVCMGFCNVNKLCFNDYVRLFALSGH